MREPKFNKSYRRALLIDAMGGGLCKIHGEYFGHGKYQLRDCPFCDIEEHFKKEKECPELRKIKAGDEAYYYCLLTERPSGRIQPCPKEYGNNCEEYDRIIKEEE